MNKLEETVEISGAALYNIVRHIIEKRSREAIGDLIGKKSNGNYLIGNAYPWVSAKTDYSNAGYGDHVARRWIIDMDKTLKFSGSRWSTVGQYHNAHYKKFEKREYIWQPDIDFFRGIMTSTEMEESIQIVGASRTKKYDNGNKPKRTTIHYAKKLRIHIINENRGHDIILASYKLTHDNIEELPLKRRKLKVVRIND
ncbi:MAG TPA: hypothetical protein VJH92_02380 [Candidatus Nanoarchaeia archaeon]|nr:hypothetical protein [Candidatus Nanoarchaeia archaeon]